MPVAADVACMLLATVVLPIVLLAMVSSPALAFLKIPVMFTAIVLAAFVCKPAIVLFETALLAPLSIAIPYNVPTLAKLFSFTDAASVALPMVLPLTLAEPPKMRIPYHDALVLLL